MKKIWKAAASFFFAAPLAFLMGGCLREDESIAPVYGVRCVDDAECQQTSGDWYCNDGACECRPGVLYGPQSCSTDEECVTQEGAGWYCNLDNTINDGCGNLVTWGVCEECDPVAVTLYGPQPVDPPSCTTDQECEDAHAPGWYCDQDNVTTDQCGNLVAWPICREGDCEPGVLYGPQPCTSDQECVDQNGEGWYCATVTFDDGCGNDVNWPMCQEGPCEPIAGPPPTETCSTDQECIDEHGEGWICDQEATVDDGCGDAIVWPQCQESICDPGVLYGPPPCTSDEDCVSWYGEGWYCDDTAEVSDGCDTWSWAMCKSS